MAASPDSSRSMLPWDLKASVLGGSPKCEDDTVTAFAAVAPTSRGSQADARLGLPCPRNHARGNAMTALHRADKVALIRESSGLRGLRWRAPSFQLLHAAGDAQLLLIGVRRQTRIAGEGSDQMKLAYACQVRERL